MKENIEEEDRMMEEMQKKIKTGGLGKLPPRITKKFREDDEIDDDEDEAMMHQFTQGGFDSQSSDE